MHSACNWASKSTKSHSPYSTNSNGARPVQQGEHIEYPHKSSPYQKVFTPGFPVSGTFGEVDKVSLYHDPARVFARKRLLHFEERRHTEAIKKEIRLLQTFRHEHSVPYYGSYMYQNQLYLVFEFCDGNLDDFLRRSPSWFSNLSEGQKANKIVNWIIDILSGIAAFHGNGGIHRDLKPQNILIKGNTLYIADFGLGKQERHVSSNPHSVHRTEKYMAPEQGKNMKYGRASDVFALGCICLELLIFGENININFFNEFRKYFGSRTCQYPGSSCYRHNLAAVSKFIAKYLRQNPVTENLLDVIEFDLLNESPLLRISARNARTKILKITSSWGFFKKEDCCSGEIGTRKFQDASMKSLLDHVGSLSLQVDLDAMEIDMVSCVGQFQRGFWR
jgi:serine/threonine protein kinase